MSSTPIFTLSANAFLPSSRNFLDGGDCGDCEVILSALDVELVALVRDDIDFAT
jgi:hypothetical protein